MKKSTSVKDVELAVIGGGPAGMTAAIEAAAGGASVIVIDAYPELGGHYFRQLPTTFGQKNGHSDDRQAERRALTDSVAELNIEVLSETVVWGIFQGEGPSFVDDRVDAPNGRPSEAPEPQSSADGFSLHLQGPHSIQTVQANCLLLATGAYDRPMVFPGWTLPGVITPGAAQMLMKGHGILPGKRVLVAGSGPLPLAAAAGLAEKGAQIVALLDIASPWDGWQMMPRALWGQWTRLREGWGYWRTLRSKRVPFLFRHAVFQAHGEDEVQAVTFGEVDPQGRPLRKTARTVDVDTVCVGLGFLPNTALTRHLGCDHFYDAVLDVFFPWHAATMETSVSGVFVAGDVTGLGGKEMSKLQGRIAGLNILSELGHLSPTAVENHIRQLEPEIERERRFTRLLRERLKIRPSLAEFASDDTIICRCEKVTAGQIRSAVADGARNMGGVKVRTRVGMGSCQGRYCESSVGYLVAREAGRAREDVGCMTVRPPVIPIPARLMTSDPSAIR